jgi:polyisoprenyl-teichoic acid--peptidoglycan teichoic acid transferase
MQRSSAGWIIGVAVVVLVAVIGFLLLSNRPTAEPGASPSPSASVAASASASVAADLLERRWTVLFVGTDHNAEREAAGEPINADSLMLVSLSADQSALTLVSLPRDTVDVPLPDGGTYEGKINELYSEQGIESLRGAMETLFGVPIDAHVVLDMDDVAALVEAAGGVDVNPPSPLADPIVDLDLEAGPQELDAATALGYVRTRVDEDYGRMGRQQEVIVSLVERLTDPDAGIDLRPLLDGLDSLETDLPLDELDALMELGRRAGDAEVTNLLIEPPLITFEGDRNDGRGYVLEADVDAIRTEVQSLIGD